MTSLTEALAWDPEVQQAYEDARVVLARFPHEDEARLAKPYVRPHVGFQRRRHLDPAREAVLCSARMYDLMYRSLCERLDPDTLTIEGFAE